MRETMAKGRVIYVLSLEIAGNSTSTAKAWLLTSMDPLSREKIWAREQLFSAVWYWIQTQKSEDVFGKNRAIDSNERTVISSDR